MGIFINILFLKNDKMKLILLLTLLGTVISVSFSPKQEGIKKAPLELVIEDICLDKPNELPKELFSEIKVPTSGGRSYAPKSYSPKTSYTPRSYSPKRSAPKSYSPKGYAPRPYSPKSYTPRPYSPKSMKTPNRYSPYQKQSYTPNTYVPRKQKTSYIPTKSATKGKNMYMPSKLGSIKGNSKQTIGDLVIPDVVLEQPKEIVIQKDSFNPQRITPKGYTPRRSYTPKSYTPGSYSPKSYSPKAYTPKSYSPVSYTPKSYTPSPYSPKKTSGYTPSYTPKGYGKGYGRDYDNGYNGGKFF